MTIPMKSNGLKGFYLRMPAVVVVSALKSSLLSGQISEN